MLAQHCGIRIQRAPTGSEVDLAHEIARRCSESPTPPHPRPRNGQREAGPRVPPSASARRPLETDHVSIGVRPTIVVASTPSPNSRNLPRPPHIRPTGRPRQPPPQTPRAAPESTIGRDTSTRATRKPANRSLQQPRSHAPAPESPASAPYPSPPGSGVERIRAHHRAASSSTAWPTNRQQRSRPAPDPPDARRQSSDEQVHPQALLAGGARLDPRQIDPGDRRRCCNDRAAARPDDVVDVLNTSVVLSLPLGGAMIRMRQHHEPRRCSDGRPAIPAWASDVRRHTPGGRSPRPDRRRPGPQLHRRAPPPPPSRASPPVRTSGKRRLQDTDGTAPAVADANMISRQSSAGAVRGGRQNQRSAQSARIELPLESADCR